MAKRNLQVYKRLTSLLAISGLLGASFPVWSSAFALNEQNAKDLGTAYAGAASSAEDASTGWYNCAGLTRLKQEQIAISGVYVNSRTTQNGRATTNLGASMGEGSAKVKDQSVIPSLHYAKRIDDSWVFALNIASPFGLKNNFKVNAFNRYMGTRAEIRTVDIGPSLAYGFNNGFSIGAGVDALYAQAKLDARVGTGNPATDGFVENTASDWGLGYHAGILYEFNNGNTRAGVHYRSKVKIKAKGNTTAALLPGVLPTAVQAELTLPESTVLSMYHSIDDQWALMADVQRTHWKRFNELRLRFDNQTQSVTSENFKDSIRYALGVSYQLCEPWKFKVGTAFDRTPTRDSNRTTAIADHNRTWVALGVQYRVTKTFALDFGYAHLFFKKANINQSAPKVIGTTQTLQSFRGTSKTRADLIGMQLTWDFV
ncbi:MAG TPA: OmpP1/FadL family transporter [Gammaproteobacteria bacterium]|nr:OmpP1/FadL family transporter [Gammaproteobacteria bacterium]